MHRTYRLPARGSLSPRVVTAVTGQPVDLPASSGLTHLQFRRFAGCPVCNLHLRSFERRHSELVEAEIHEVVVFHSSAADLRPHTERLPFPTIPDPGKTLYREFGVESSPLVMLNPRSWPTIVRSVARSLWLLVRGRTKAPALRPEGGRYGKPADFLFDSNGELVASRYGEHLDDNWSVDDVLQLAAEWNQKRRGDTHSRERRP